MKNGKMTFQRSLAGFFAAALLATDALAAPVCDSGAAAALKTAAVQQELMVAGLTCGDEGAYNLFVQANRTELQKSDAALMRYFRQRDGKEAGYDSYKTKLANLAAGRSASDSARYCANARSAFAAARGQSLSAFVSASRLQIAAPEACAIKYDRVTVAEADTSYGAGPATQSQELPRPPRPPVRRAYGE